MTRLFHHEMLQQRKTRIGLLVGMLSLLLIVEVWQLTPLVLARWNAFDYGNYVLMGRALRDGVNPYGWHRYYPLPTVMWIFVLLSVLPDWFRLVWVIVPLLSVFIIARRSGLWWLFFPPVWFVIGDGMLDGWLLLPLCWLFRNQSGLAGVGAALLLLKPQLALPVVLYKLGEWVWYRDKRNLGLFVAASVLLWIPSFVVRPFWIGEMLATLPQRAAQNTEMMPLMTSSIWSWWWFGGIGYLIFGVVALASLGLFWRGLRQHVPVALLLQSLNLLWNPLFFASAAITVVPALRDSRRIVLVVVAGLVAVGASVWTKEFGGLYVIATLVAMAVMQATPFPSNISSHDTHASDASAQRVRGAANITELSR
jgi:hypothetical protein